MAPCGLNFYIFINFHEPHANKNQNYQPKNENKFQCFLIHMYTHQAQQQNTFPGKKLRWNVTTKNIKDVKFLILKMKWD